MRYCVIVFSKSQRGFLNVRINMKQNIVTKYVKSSLQELTQVTWPTKNQAVKLTIIVLIFCILFGTFLTVADLGLTELYKLVIK